MPTVTRDDGVQFAVRAYRELLTAKSASLIKREIRLLERSHGSYAQLFPQPDGQLEAVFSRDPGYLLGETVANHFDNPADLIYCERLGDSDDVLLVVVRSGSVYLDAKLSVDNLIDELTSIGYVGHHFQVYLYGELPIGATEEEGLFSFPQEAVESFEYLDSPVFDSLPSLRQFELMPVSRAISKAKVGGRSPLTLLLLIIVALLLGYLVYDYMVPTTTPTVTKPVTEAGKPEKPINPYEQFELALQKPSPVEQLSEIVKDINSVSTIPGWEVASFSYTRSGMRFTFNSVGGTLAMLHDWGRVNKYPINIATNNFTLYLPSKVKSRSKPTQIANAQAVYLELIKRVSHVLYLPDGGQSQGASQDTLVQFVSAQSQGNFREIRVAVNFTNIAPQTFVMLGHQLQGLPINLEQVNATSADGLFSGKIDLVIVGE